MIEFHDNIVRFGFDKPAFVDRLFQKDTDLLYIRTKNLGII